MAKFKPGDKVRVSPGSGTLSGKTGAVVQPREVKTDGRGIPTNIKGAYSPVDWKKEVAVRLDNGELITMFKNRLIKESNMFKEISKKLEEVANSLSEQKLGTIEKEIMDYLSKAGEDVSLSDLAAIPAFRGKHFSKIMDAAERLAKKGLIKYRRDRVHGDTYSIRESIHALGTTGLRRLEPTGIHLEPNTIYYLGASSSPDLIMVTKVTDDLIFYKIHPFQGKELRIRRIIGEDLIRQGTETWLSYYARYQPERAKAMRNVLAGKPGEKINPKDYKPVEVHVELKDGVDLNKAWPEAERFGNVGGFTKYKGAENEVLGIETYKKEVPDIKKSRLWDVVKVTDRR